MHKPKIILTGGSGFIGRRFIEYNKDKFDIHAISLQKTDIDSIDFSNVESIVHLAGIAHQINNTNGQIYYDVNRNLTEKLAQKAKESGVGHFLFVSSVKVYGEESGQDVMTEHSPTNPQDDYGKSKLQAEQILRGLENHYFKVAVVRPPLVYGAGVKGNMLKIIGLVNKNYPLPFKNILNQRSMVFLDNLIELMNTIIQQKASGTFLAGDSKPISTSELVSMINQHLGNSNNWFSLPNIGVALLKKLKPELVIRLYGSFVMDTENSYKKLNFKPPYSTQEGIAQMVAWYKNLNSEE